MQEEIEQKSFNIMISTTKLSARTVLRAVKAAFRLYQSKASQGKQSVRTLLRQNRGVSSVEISKTGIRGLERYAKKYGIDYAIRKDTSEVPPRYLVFFKAPDAEAFHSAFKEYIQKANRLIREIRAQIGKLKEWIGELFKARETAPEHPPQSPGLANLLMKYLSVQREKSRKYSQSWQRQHAADELKTVSKAVSYLSEHGISTLAELDAALSSVSDQADSIREGMKTAEKRMKELQKLIEYGKNYTEYKPIHDELKKLKNGWTSKRDKYEEAHRAELTLWNAASRYLHANLPKGTKTLPISEWEKEYATLSGQRTAEYTKLKETRAEVAELHNIRKCVDIALKADQPEQTRAKRHDLER